MRDANRRLSRLEAASLTPAGSDPRAGALIDFVDRRDAFTAGAFWRTVRALLGDMPAGEVVARCGGLVELQPGDEEIYMRLVAEFDSEFTHEPECASE